MGCRFATLIGAGFTSSILAPLHPSAGREISPVVRYLAGMGLVGTVVVLLTRESKDHVLETHQHRPPTTPTVDVLNR